MSEAATLEREYRLSMGEIWGRWGEYKPRSEFERAASTLTGLRLASYGIRRVRGIYRGIGRLFGLDE